MVLYVFFLFAFLGLGVMHLTTEPVDMAAKTIGYFYLLCFVGLLVHGMNVS